MDPGGSAAWFRRHAPPAPARASGLCVGRQGRSNFALRRMRFIPAAAARLIALPEGRPPSLAGHFRIDVSTPVPLARASKLAFRPASRSFAAPPLARHCCSVRARSSPWHRRLRGSAGPIHRPIVASAVACAPAWQSIRLAPEDLSNCRVLAHKAVSKIFRGRHPRIARTAVSRRHQRSTDPCKLLILLWFPAARSPSYNHDAVTDAESCKGRNDRPCLLITWITGKDSVSRRGSQPGAAS